MARDWLWELEAQGNGWRVRGLDKDLLIVPSNRVHELSPSGAVATLQRVLANDPSLRQEARIVGSTLRGAGASAASRERLGRSAARAGAGGEDAEVEEALRAIGEALSRGDLVALQVRNPQIITDAEIQMLEELRRKRSIPAPPLPPPRPPVDEPLRTYSVRVLDDTGAPVAGVRLKLEIDGTPKMPTTDAAGLATTQWFSKAPARVRVLDQAELENRLASRWAEPLSKTLSSGALIYRLSVGRPFSEVNAPADRETTLILCRQSCHCFEVIVYDGMGRLLSGVGLVVSVDGGEQSLTTDDAGIAVCEGASESAVARLADPDSVRALLAQRALHSPDQADLDTIADAVTVAIGTKRQDIVLKHGVPNKVVLRREVVRVRLIGMHFDHARCFLLPSALEGLRKLNQVYADHPNANLLVVGHTDTRHRQESDDRGADFNKQLSLDRARAVAAYLTNAVDAWYAWYDVDGERRWGGTEDVYMLSSVPVPGEPYYREGENYPEAVRKYQASKQLPTTGTVGARTRHALIADYMSADGTTLPAGATVTCHGCGPFFPDVPSGPNDDVQQNRRVEILVFDGPIVPPPRTVYSEAASTEYSAWLAQVTETVDFSTNDVTCPSALHVRLCDVDLLPYKKRPVTIRFPTGERIAETDDKGILTVDVPAKVDWIELLLSSGSVDVPTRIWRLNVGSLQPSTSIPGAAARLRNLDYYAGPPCTAMTRALRDAVALFQHDWELPVTGSLDPATTQKLDEVYEQTQTNAADSSVANVI